MWARKYKDYPVNGPLKKERVEPGKGIIGCEMCENFGWNGVREEMQMEPARPFPEEELHL